MKESESEKIIELNDNVLYTVLMSTVPIFIVQVIGVIESVIFSSYQSDVLDTFIIWTSMGIGLCLIPYFVVKKIYNMGLIELGVKKIEKKEIVLGIVIMVALYIYLFTKEKSYLILLSVSLQTLGVAITEEFWARGILCYMLEKMLDKKWIVIIINSLIFTFITHMNRPFLDNLLFRLPGSVCMVLVYMKSKKLSYSVLVHYVYNMLGNF